MALLDNLTDSQKMIVIQNSLIDMSSKLDRHHKLIVEGNGEKPLMERMRNVEAFIDGIKFWQRTIAVALVLQVIGSIGTGLFFLARVMPLLAKIANQP